MAAARAPLPTRSPPRNNAKFRRLLFALLTGQYAFRQRGTGGVGKWHLGLGTGGVDWNADVKPGPLEIGFTDSYIMAATGDRVPCVFVDGHRVAKLESSDPIAVSCKGKIGDEPTGKENPELLRIHPSHGHDQTIVNGISRIGCMTGGKTARWIDENAGHFSARGAGLH